jgi:4-hydroxy-tetrahydrodipicolinate synthase
VIGADVTVDAIHAEQRPDSVTAVSGVVPPIPTPFLDGKVDLTSLRRVLDYLHASVDGVLVGGSTGETPSLTVAEREAIIRTVATHLDGDRFLVVSIADNSIENTKRLAAVAAECGAALLVLSCPSYFPNDLGMLEAYFGAVAAFSSGDLCLYDNPMTSKTWLSVHDIHALVAAVPRLNHVKLTDPTREKAARLRERESLRVFAGDDSVLWHHLDCGADGVMTAIPLIRPEVTARMWRAVAEGQSRAAYAEYRGLSHFIHIGLSAPDYPAVVKTVLHERGVLASSELRPPLLPLTPGRHSEIFQALDIS